MATSVTAASVRQRSSFRNWFGADQVAYAICSFFAVLVVVITLALLVGLWIKADPARSKFGFGILTSTLWNPVTDEYGAWPFIYGTLVTSFLALLISVPLGVG